MYYSELNSVFSDYLDIIPYSIEIDHEYQKSTDCLKSADVILLTNPNLFTFIKHMIKSNCIVLNLDYAFLKNKVESLKNFHENTNALVCFNFHEVSNQVAKTIYGMGITNLNLTVYNPDVPVLENTYDMAIVGENSHLVPQKINTIVSLGTRKISFETLINLAISTKVLDDRLENRIYLYSEEITFPSVFMNDIFVNSPDSKSQFKAIMNNIDYSIIILDKNFKIITHNSNLIHTFNIEEDILNKQITEVANLYPVSEQISNNKEIKNILIEIKKNIKAMLSIQKIDAKHSINSSYIILIKLVTEATKQETGLRKKSVRNGHTAKYEFSDIYGESKEIKECIKKANIISKLDKTLLIVGESGTGKELFAQSIHNASSRKDYPFISVNCAAIPSALLESELFGYEDGTFTGGRKGGKAGLFEIAHRGTLFLDEIGDMTLETQAKLLRVLEEKEFMKLGSGEVIFSDFRIIAATNRSLRDLIKEGKFRLDLFYRLNTLMLTIPALRHRKEDIPFLINIFLNKQKDYFKTIDKDVFEFLINYTFEGNIRELKNCIDYMVNMSEGNIKMEHIPEYISDVAGDENNSAKEDIFYFLNDYEKEIVLNLLNTIGYFGGGRRSLHQELIKKYPNLTKYKLRQYISILIENKLVQVEAGRIGMKLTERGKNLAQ
jgi:transcriptional regulator with PAS, ATPase and Fis domain